MKQKIIVTLLLVLASRGEAAAQALSSDSIKVVLLGTGVGPRINLQQYGASTLVEAGGERLLFDCGRGTTVRLSQMQIPVGSITRLFLTHLHSDHIVQIPDLLLTGWVPGRRNVPLEVWGPLGTSEMMNGMLKAFDFDIRMRRDVDEKFPASGIRVLSHDIDEGVIFEKNGVKVTAFLVDHGPVRPAFGYRIDYRGRSVVLSGDTRPSDNLIRAARGTDVLVHEAIDPDALRNSPDRPDAATMDSIVAHHTTFEQAGQIFKRVAPRLAVYSHAPPTKNLVAETRKAYTGRLEGPEDLLTIVVRDSIEVRRFAR